MVAILAATLVFTIIWLWEFFSKLGDDARKRERSQRVLVDYKNEFNKYPRDTKGGK